MENILVAGANGTTGKQIINLLKESQYFNPIAMVRDETQFKSFENQNVDVVMADLEKDVSHVFKNNTIDKVIFAAGSGGKKVEEVDQNGAKRMIHASVESGVKKFVMLSSMGADKPKEADQLVEYLKAKHNADEYLKNSSLNYAIVRPGTLNNESATDKIELEEKLNKRGEISRADVAQTLIRSLNDDTANKKTFEIISGETLIGKALHKVSAIEA
ncbi:SDR family oxidoreductase [Lacinutrix neustonica]|uniref:SDR family oxidoreductase n=1 Tax=Lacinutrix neustonica TaxID=2980107 RepID=A0A9E8MWJ6_9FLAO|nr:SDR family oxidoreductase [Lacinutrix neustonica]WAC02828.1 SDR family oxidoreductase [Lacinutrix neustonica]